MITSGVLPELSFPYRVLSLMVHFLQLLDLVFLIVSKGNTVAIAVWRAHVRLGQWLKLVASTILLETIFIG